MFIKKKALIVCATLLPACFSLQALAVDVGLALELQTTHTNNALQLAEDPISEQQNRFNFTLGLQEDVANWGIEADYVLSRVVFSEESQEEQSFFNGDASLRLGANRGLFQFFLDHSRRLSLINPLAGEALLVGNAQDRDIVSARPQLNFRLSPVETLSVNANHTTVRFSENALRDTDRTGGTLSYTRRLTPVDTIFARYSLLNVAFNDLTQSEIRYQTTEVGYRAELRDISYEIIAGYNQSERAGETFGDSTISAELTYDNRFVEIAAQYSRELTDNSIGQGESALPEGQDTIVNGEFNLPDQYVDAQWALSLGLLTVCNQCALDFSYTYNTEDYDLFVINNLEQSVLRVNYRYDFIGRSDINFSYNKREIEFVNNNAASQTFDEIQVNYQYAYSDDLNFSVIAENIKRNGAISTSIATEKRVGLSLAYAFR